MILSRLLPEPNRRQRSLLTREQIQNPYPAFLYKYRTGHEGYLDHLAPAGIEKSGERYARQGSKSLPQLMGTTPGTAVVPLQLFATNRYET